MLITMLLSELIYDDLGKEKGIKREQKGKEKGQKQPLFNTA